MSKWSALRWMFALAFGSVALALSASGDSASDLASILSKMDATASEFRTAQANFTWTTFNSVVNEISDTQTGAIYFQRSGSEIKMAADISSPGKKQVVFSQGKIEVYQPSLDTVDVWAAGAHREEFETFLVLGFGSSGKDMLKSFDIKYEGKEKIDGEDTAKLTLTPKAEGIKAQFPQIVLWINPETGISVQQKLFEANGDYRIAKYSDIRLRQKIPESVFKLKTQGKTKIVTHQ